MRIWVRSGAECIVDDEADLLREAEISHRQRNEKDESIPHLGSTSPNNA